MSKSEELDRAHRIKAEQEAHIASTMADDLIDECLERLVPILTHDREVRPMRIPVDYEHDDDVFILERLREVRRRLRMEPRNNLLEALGDVFCEHGINQSLQPCLQCSPLHPRNQNDYCR